MIKLYEHIRSNSSNQFYIMILLIFVDTPMCLPFLCPVESVLTPRVHTICSTFNHTMLISAPFNGELESNLQFSNNNTLSTFLGNTMLNSWNLTTLVERTKINWPWRMPTLTWVQETWSLVVQWWPKFDPWKILKGTLQFGIGLMPTMRSTCDFVANSDCTKKRAPQCLHWCRSKLTYENLSPISYYRL